MNRPCRAWCVSVVALGVLAGCNKQPTGTASTGKADPAPAPKSSVAVKEAPNIPPPSGPVKVAPCKFDAVEKTIADAKGKVVLIDCWATWCPPCVSSFPKLVEKHQKYGSKGLAVVSVSLDRSSDAGKVLAFLQKQNATFTNLHLTVDAAAQKGLTDKFAYEGGIPHAVLFDKSGKRVWSGHPMDPELAPLIEAELAKSGPAQG
ncbi:MAG TPA: thioredoxin-like domain-containing protein [Gemmataceae bacterium]|nr:thioredoxin-like domain-containing protein [Gemmataceae bacterium]